MAKRKEIRNSTAEFLIFQAEDKGQGIEVIYKDENVWCTQKAMATLFDCSTDNVGLHLKNIFASGELVKDSVTEKISATASDGKNYLTQFYNLDAIISVGYRVNSRKATRFRQWATRTLNEYIRKGFVMDDERLKELGGGNYWKELIERIRDIRSSEKVMSFAINEGWSNFKGFLLISDISIGKTIFNIKPAGERVYSQTQSTNFRISFFKGGMSKISKTVFSCVIFIKIAHFDKNNHYFMRVFVF